MTNAVAEPSVHNRRSAPRFDIAAPVLYRAGDGEWLDATTVNIGRLGLLMRTTHPLQRPETALQLRVALTTDASRPGGHIACSGRVVRVEPCTGAGNALIAVTIESFHLDAHAFDADAAGAQPEQQDVNPNAGVQTTDTPPGAGEPRA